MLPKGQRCRARRIRSMPRINKKLFLIVSNHDEVRAWTDIVLTSKSDHTFYDINVIPLRDTVTFPC